MGVGWGGGGGVCSGQGFARKCLKFALLCSLLFRVLPATSGLNQALANKISSATRASHNAKDKRLCHRPLVSTAGSCQVACTGWSQVVTRFVGSFSSRDFSLAHGCCQLAATEGRAGDAFIVHVVLREINKGV